MAYSIQGPAAEVLWGYHLAGILGHWEITMKPDGGRLTATMVGEPDAFRLTQTPLYLRVVRPTGKGWKWRLSEVQTTGTTLTAAVSQED